MSGAPMEVIAGTACQVGEQAFTKVCAPMLNVVATAGNPREVASMYLGFYGAMFGAMVKQLGKDAAIALLSEAQEAFGRMEFPPQQGGRLQ